VAACPKRQASVSFSETSQLTLGEHTLDPGDVVWIRRIQQPQPNPQVAPADKKFSDGEYRWFFQAVMYLIETLPVRCINKYSASRFINNKSVQLLLARSCGMHVPHTLISNSPAAVRTFVQNNPKRMICKSFYPHIWEKESGTSYAVTETFELKAEMLPRDEVLTYAPAIYQDMVVKPYDVRLVLLGNAVYSYSLHHASGALDWRQDSSQGMVTAKIIETPAEVEQSVLVFAAQAGISFGSCDFAVDAEGRWWYLEINEGGQFLWLDEFNENIHLFEKFLAFLTGPEGASKAAIEERQSEFPSLRDYMASSAKEMIEPEQPATETPFMSREP